MIGPIDLYLSAVPHFKVSTNCHRISEHVLPISRNLHQVLLLWQLELPD